MTLEWILIIGAVAGMAGVVFWLVWSSATDEAAEVAGSEHFPAAFLAASHITADARAALPPARDTVAVGRVNERYGRECRDLMVAYRDIGLRARWDDAAEGDTRATFEGVADPPARARCVVAVGEGSLPAPPAAQVQPAGPEVFVVGDVAGRERTWVTFVVSLSEAWGRPVTVDYETRDGSALSDAVPADFRGVSGSVTFVAGERSKQVPVWLLSDDNDREGDESFELCLTAARGARVRPEGEGGCATATIEDGPAVQLPRMSVSDTSANEGLRLRFVVALDVSAPSDVSVGFETVEGSATEADYVPRSERVTIPQGRRSVTVAVASKPDDLFELPESFGVRLSGAAGATIADENATGTIIDDDTARRPVVSIANAEASEGKGTITFELTLSPASGAPASVEASTVNDSAEAPDDFTALKDARVDFDAGQTRATLEVQLRDDPDVEPVETFEVVLANPRNATVSPGAGGRAVGTITDDDVADPQILVDGAGRVIEGAVASFTVRLSRPAAGSVSVDWELADGTATRPGDYASTIPNGRGVAQFRPGDTSVTVEVDTVDDTDVESDETFELRVTGSRGAVGRPAAAATILDDDGTPEVRVGDAWARESLDGSEVVFPVRLNRVSSRAVTLSWWTEQDPTAEHRATPGDDYTPTHTRDRKGVLVIGAGETAGSLAVPVLDDDLDEHDELFRLFIDEPTGATLANATIRDGLAAGTIRDDDEQPELRIHPYKAFEGADLTFDVRLNTASGRVVTADVTTSDGTAKDEEDYIGIDASDGVTVEIPAGTTKAEVIVKGVQDLLPEDDETFLVLLSKNVNATLAEDGWAIGTIVDDEKPRLSVAGVTVTEGTDSDAVFVVALNPAAGENVTFTYATAALPEGAQPGTECDDDSENPVDYLTVPAATGTIDADKTELTVAVTICDDAAVEETEAFTLILTDIAGAVGANDAGTTVTATGTILDNDGIPRITVDDPRASEGDGTITFTVTLSHAGEEDVRVRYATSDGTATWSGDYPDYLTTTGTLTIPAGETEDTIDVPLIDDAYAEIRNRGKPTETNEEDLFLRLTLPTPSNPGEPPAAEIEDPEATGTIVDDDPFPVVVVYDTHANEDDGTVTVRVELDKPHNEEITVPYRTEDQELSFTALSDRERCYPTRYTTSSRWQLRYKGEDPCPSDLGAVDPPGYVSASGTLVFPPGSLVQTFAVTILDNDDTNPHGYHRAPITVRSFRVVLHRLSGDHCLRDGYPDLPACGLVHVLDDEGQPYVHFTHPIVADRLESAGTLDFEVDIGGHAIDEAITVSYRTDPLLNNCLHGRPEATAGADYRTNASRTVTVVTCEQDAQGQTRIRQRNNVPVTVSPVWGVWAGTVTIPAGERSATIEIPILDDKLEDDDIIEYLQVRLLRVTSGNATIRSGSGIVPISRGGIIDDDTLPELSVGNAEAAEDGGRMRFRATLNRPSATEVRVSYATADLGDADAATAGDDYTAVSGTLRIPAGDVSAFIDVPILDDGVDESDERFALNLTALPRANVTITGASAEGTILDDDELPVLTVEDVADYEDPYGRTILNGYLHFRLRLSKLNEESVTFTYGFEEVPSLGEYAALRSLDFRDYYSGSGRRSGTVTLPEPDEEGCWFRSRRGEDGCSHEPLTWTISLYTVGDDIPERDERLRLWLSDPVGVVLGDVEAWGTILNNDQPILSIGNVDVSESATHATFTVKLHAPGLEETSVRYRTKPWLAGTARANPAEDYTHTEGTLTIAAGTTTAEVSVPILDDTVDEYDEAFVLQLYAADGLDLANAEALARIIDDDPGWWINDASAAEDDPTPTVTFVVRRDEPVDSAVTLHYDTYDGGATGGPAAAGCTDGVDYLTPPGSVEFAAGVAKASIDATVCDDDTVEGGETFTVSLRDVTGRRTTATGTITDD